MNLPSNATFLAISWVYVAVSGFNSFFIEPIISKSVGGGCADCGGGGGGGSGGGRDGVTARGSVTARGGVTGRGGRGGGVSGPTTCVVPIDVADDADDGCGGTCCFFSFFNVCPSCVDSTFRFILCFNVRPS